jgi:hypothetical protein
MINRSENVGYLANIKEFERAVPDGLDAKAFFK